MRFLIYIPNTEGDVTPKDEKLSKVGLAALSQGCATIATAAGPDGKPGVVFSWPDPRDPRSTMGYLPDIQEWIPAEAIGDYAAKRYWVGFVKGLPPTPYELAQPVLLEGDEVLLGDGRKWIIPAAATLPKTSRYIGGQWGWVVQSEFESYWNESSQWYFDLVTKELHDGQATVSADCCDYLTRALGMNYRLTHEVVSHLGLFNTRTIGPALLATVHGITLREELAQKKTDDTPHAI